MLTTERANNEIKNAMGKIEEKEREIKALIQELQATRYQKRLAFAIILLLIVAIILLIIRF
jgi:t-SNARE complex subunit (syntaxin)